MIGTLAGVRSADIVLVRFDPAFGHEQAGTRPGLVVSDDAYNAHSSFVVLCPITRNAKPWPFKVPLPDRRSTEGFILVDQLKSVDRRRIVRRLGTIPTDTMSEVRALIDLVLAKATPDPA
jgi:mRNA interferase MazF